MRSSQDRGPRGGMTGRDMAVAAASGTGGSGLPGGHDLPSHGHPPPSLHSCSQQPVLPLGGLEGGELGTPLLARGERKHWDPPAPPWGSLHASNMAVGASRRSPWSHQQHPVASGHCEREGSSLLPPKPHWEPLGGGFGPCWQASLEPPPLQYETGPTGGHGLGVPQEARAP